MERDFLESLVLAHQAEVYRYMRYLGASRTVSEDLVQETFLAVFQSPCSCEELEVSVRAALLRGIARNLFLNHWRRHKHDPVSVDPDHAEAVWKDEFLHGSDGFDYTEALRKCLEMLQENQRKLLDMRYRDKASRAEMARMFNMTGDGIKSFLRRTRGVLADCVEKRLKAEGTS